MIKVLFICHGNICRSPMAEYLFKDYVSKKNMDSSFEIVSKATSTEELGNPIYPPVKRILDSLNIDSSKHRASRVKESDYDYYDYIVCMDDNNIYNLKRIFKNGNKHKITKLLDYTDLKRDVLDPWYTRNFIDCYNDIVKGIDCLYHYIIKDNLTK